MRKSIRRRRDAEVVWEGSVRDKSGGLVWDVLPDFEKGGDEYQLCVLLGWMEL